jgi:hypothetical protein
MLVSFAIVAFIKNLDIGLSWSRLVVTLSQLEDGDHVERQQIGDF